MLTLFMDGPQCAFLHFKKYKKILLTCPLLGKNEPNFVYPILILHNQSHDNLHILTRLIASWLQHHNLLSHSLMSHLACSYVQIRKLSGLRPRPFTYVGLFIPNIPNIPHMQWYRSFLE